jgi:hypothetical protein
LLSLLHDALTIEIVMPNKPPETPPSSPGWFWNRIGQGVFSAAPAAIGRFCWTKHGGAF